MSGLYIKNHALWQHSSRGHCTLNVLLENWMWNDPLPWLVQRSDHACLHYPINASMATINCLFIGHRFPNHGSNAASFRDVTMVEAHTHISAVMHDPGRLSSSVYCYAMRTQCDLTAEAHLILYSEGWLLLFRFPSVCWFIYLYCSFCISHGLFFHPAHFVIPRRVKCPIWWCFYGLAWQLLNVFRLMIWQLSCTLTTQKKKKNLNWSLLV